MDDPGTFFDQTGQTIQVNDGVLVFVVLGIQPQPYLVGAAVVQYAGFGYSV
jgi:hypothetical protein